MGYIDADTHVIGGYWTIQDVALPYPDPGMTQWMTEIFRSVDLQNPQARLRYRDEVGVDVQVLFPSLWLLVEVSSPAREAAMSRSYNRWLAERKAAIEAFEQQQLFVSAQMDDDLPYLLQLTGPGQLVHGTDFGHLDLDYGIDPDFRPAPPPSIDGLALPPGLAAAH